MSNGWDILDTGCAHAQTNMRIDADLLENLFTHPRPTLHFYDWEGDSASYGHFIDPDCFLNLKAVGDKKLQLAKRPTGGGIIFHIGDLAFSVLIPAGHVGYSVNTLDNYAFINRHIIQAIYRFLDKKEQPILLPSEKKPLDNPSRHFCMAQPTIYDVMVEGRKVSGGAQRRTKHGFLHQGTIALTLPSEEFLKEVLKPGTCVFKSMQEHSYPLLQQSSTAAQLEKAKQALRGHLIQAFTGFKDAKKV